MTPELKKLAEEGDVTARLKWVTDEINEFKFEARYSEAWYMEFLDVIGFLVVYKDTPEIKDLIIKQVPILPEWNDVKKRYYDWSKKNTDKGRTPLPLADVEQVYKSLL